MENKDFDKIIRSKLDNFDPGLDAQDWNLFAQKMAIADAAGADDFDDFFKEKLENITVEPEPNAWSVFQEKMVLDEILFDEPVDAFDVLVKDKLDGVAPPMVAGSWAAFEEKLELEETLSTETIEDMYIDALAYDKLNALEESYNPAHWSMMEQKLDEEDSVFAFFFKYKIAEAALILLALITLNQFYPLDKVHSLIIPTEKAEVVDAQDQNNFIVADVTDETLVLAQSDKPVDLPAGGEMVWFTPIEENINLGIIGVIQPTEGVAANTVDGNGGNSGTDNNELLAEKEESANKAIAAAKKEKASRGKIQEIRIVVEENVRQVKKTVSDDDIMIPFAPGVSIAAAQLDDEIQADVEDEVLPECESCKRPIVTKPYLRVGMVSAFDLNHVMVPYDRIFDTAAVNIQGFGYGNGISIGMRFGKWELESGAIYSSRNYTPPRRGDMVGNITDGYLTDILGKVSLSTLNIPLNLKYAFKNNEKWSMYVLGGSNLNLLLSTNYDREQEFSGEQTYSAKIEKINDSILSQKRFDPGLLEGGSFLQNHYYTLNLGFGLERHLSSRWSIFTQSTYHHHMFSDGIGPNNDKINTLSIFAGAKVSLR